MANAVQFILPQLVVLYSISLIVPICTSLAADDITVTILFTIGTIVLLLFLRSSMSTELVIALAVPVFLLIAFTITEVKGAKNSEPVMDDAEMKFILELEELAKMQETKWDEYFEHCHRLAWKMESVAETQWKCSERYGFTAVKWTGEISFVKLSDIRKKHTGEATLVSLEIAVNVLSSNRKASHENWHFFSSETAQEKLSLVYVSIEYENDTGFVNATQLPLMGLKPGDRIEFFGLLDKAWAGSLKPLVNNVVSLKCVQCAVVPEFTELAPTRTSQKKSKTDKHSPFSHKINMSGEKGNLGMRDVNKSNDTLYELYVRISEWVKLSLS